MKTNRMRLTSFVLCFIVFVFTMGACTPSASTPTPVNIPAATDAPASTVISAPTSTLSAVEACDVSKVDITGVHWFREPDGAWRIVGMLHNNSDQPIAKVFADVETRDKNDKSAYPESADTLHPTGPGGEDYSFYPLNLLPGSEAPFTAWIKREIPNLDHFTIEKDLCVVAEPDKRLQVQERGGQLLVDDGSGMAQVTVELVNPTQQTALVNGTMVGLFDGTGNLITAVYAAVTPRILLPGESGPVRATLALPPGGAAQVKSYKLYMDILASESSPKLLDVQKDIQVDARYLDTAGHFHLVGQIVNPGTQPLMISVQATVYTDSAKTAVADAAALDTLIPLAPGATLPFDLTDWQVLNNRAGLWDALSRKNAAVVLRVEPFRTWTTTTSIAPLTVIADTPAFHPQEATFTGQVKNETAGNVLLGTVTVVLRDPVTEKIVATHQASLDVADGFAPGEMRSYSIAIPLVPGFDPQRVQVEITASGQQT